MRWGRVLRILADDDADALDERGDASPHQEQRARLGYRLSVDRLHGGRQTQRSFTRVRTLEDRADIEQQVLANPAPVMPSPLVVRALQERRRDRVAIEEVERRGDARQRRQKDVSAAQVDRLNWLCGSSMNTSALSGFARLSMCRRTLEMPTLNDSVNSGRDAREARFEIQISRTGAEIDLLAAVDRR